MTNSDKYFTISPKHSKKVLCWRWMLNVGYPRRVEHPQVFLHTFLFGTPPRGFEWDHKNGNSLDYREKNLRLATHSQNMWNQGPSKANKSGFKGVSWYSRLGLWYVQIKVFGKIVSLGYFRHLNEAAMAYDRAARKYHREFARPNIVRFPRESKHQK